MAFLLKEDYSSQNLIIYLFVKINAVLPVQFRISHLYISLYIVLFVPVGAHTTDRDCGHFTSRCQGERPAPQYSL